MKSVAMRTADRLFEPAQDELGEVFLVLGVAEISSLDWLVVVNGPVAPPVPLRSSTVGPEPVATEAIEPGLIGSLEAARLTRAMTTYMADLAESM